MRLDDVENDTMLTLGNRQKANQNEGVLVGSPNVIMDIPNREVNWVVFMLASCNGNGRFVTSEYDGDEECSMGIDVNSNQVLYAVRLANVGALGETHLHIVSRPSHPT